MLRRQGSLMFYPRKFTVSPAHMNLWPGHWKNPISSSGLTNTRQNTGNTYQSKLALPPCFKSEYSDSFQDWLMENEMRQFRHCLQGMHQSQNAVKNRRKLSLLQVSKRYLLSDLIWMFLHSLCTDWKSSLHKKPHLWSHLQNKLLYSQQRMKTFVTFIQIFKVT